MAPGVKADWDILMRIQSCQSFPASEFSCGPWMAPALSESVFLFQFLVFQNSINDRVRGAGLYSCSNCFGLCFTVFIFTFVSLRIPFSVVLSEALAVPGEHTINSKVYTYEAHSLLSPALNRCPGMRHTPWPHCERSRPGLSNCQLWLAWIYLWFIGSCSPNSIIF